MNEDIKPAWLDMSDTRLRKHLRAQKYPEPFIENILFRVRRAKAERRRSRIKTTVTHQMWDDVLRPARTELGTVRTTLSKLKRAVDESFGNPDIQAKFDAYKTYESVLASTIEKLRKVQQGKDYTPLQFAEALRKAGKMPTDKAGDHWTHYISAKSRRMVEDAFFKAPKPLRGKTKEPFEERLSPEHHDRLRDALVGRLHAEQMNAEQEYEMATNSFERERLDKLIQEMHRAYYVINQLQIGRAHV